MDGIKQSSFVDVIDLKEDKTEIFILKKKIVTLSTDDCRVIFACYKLNITHMLPIF